MPELPEVETIRRDIEPRIVGREIAGVTVGAGPRYGDVSATAGRIIRGVARRGKYLLFDLGDLELVVHLGMSGRLFLSGVVPDSPHLRAVFDLAGGDHLVFEDMRKFGTLAIVTPGAHGGIPTLAAMGPEPLADEFRKQPFVRAVARPGAPIKAMLLGQKVVAGLGNIYADEALHRAGIHPLERGVERARAVRLHQAIRDVLAEAIANRGTTFSLYRDGNLTEGNHYAELRAYDREGLPCKTCGTPIVKIRVSARGTYFCPACQPAPLSALKVQ